MFPLSYDHRKVQYQKPTPAHTGERPAPHRHAYTRMHCRKLYVKEQQPTFAKTLAGITVTAMRRFVPTEYAPQTVASQTMS